jgi:hypothetical protein
MPRHQRQGKVTVVALSGAEMLVGVTCAKNKVKVVAGNGCSGFSVMCVQTENVAAKMKGQKNGGSTNILFVINMSVMKWQPDQTMSSSVAMIADRELGITELEQGRYAGEIMHDAPGQRRSWKNAML